MKAIIFDLDGVICSTDHYHYLAWKSLADDLNIPFDEKDNERLRGVSRMESLDIILEKSKENYSLKEKEQFADRKNKLYQQYLLKMSTKDLSKEVKETLEQLRKKGLKLAIGSSSKNTMLILQQLGLDTFFEAADLLKIPYKECLVVEDAISGCFAAKSASMNVAALSSAYHCTFADYHLNCFKELLDIKY